MPYKIDDDSFKSVAPIASNEMDELDLSKAKQHAEEKKSLGRSGRYDGMKPVEELPPLKIDTMGKDKRYSDTSNDTKPEMSYSKHKHSIYRTDEERRQRKRGIITGAVVLVGIYVFMFIYIKSVNHDYILETSEELTSVGISSLALTSANYDTEVSDYDKEVNGLSLALADSDGDGLSDAYELSKNISNPNGADSDSDGLSDGVEILAGLGPKNPKTDGVTNDKDVAFERSIDEKNVSLSLKGNAGCYVTQMNLYKTPLTNHPGVIGGIYEIYSVGSSAEAILSFDAGKDILSKWNSKAENLAVYLIDTEDSKFKEVSGVTLSGGKISVPIKYDGVYALADKTIVNEKSSVNVFFLIDNSGSMYSEEECDNSEENDIEFKRVDLAEDIMDSLGKGVQFGAAKFTQKYTLLTPLSTDRSAVKESIEKIKDGDENFNGTEIAVSLRRAADEFADNATGRNYIILLTDGNSTTTNTARENQAIEYCIKKNITVITIGLGKQITPTYLVETADKTNGMFFKVSNAEGLNPVCEKICSLVETDRIGEKDDANGDLYVISDTGYNYVEDGMHFGIPTTDNPESYALGTATLNKLYYSGNLNMTENSAKIKTGGELGGYDISEHPFFEDTKQDLSGLVLECAKAYDAYLAIEDKWDFAHVTNEGKLNYTAETKSFLTSNNMEISTKTYTGVTGEDDALLNVMKVITFQKLKPFTTYETAIVNTSDVSSGDKSVIDALNYYDKLYLTDGAKIYSFGANGDTAFSVLNEELTSGMPSVVTTENRVYNVARLMRKSDDPNTYILEAYDVNSGKDAVKIKITKNTLYDDMAGTKAQYRASVDEHDVPLYIYA